MLTRSDARIVVAALFPSDDPGARPIRLFLAKVGGPPQGCFDLFVAACERFGKASLAEFRLANLE